MDTCGPRRKPPHRQSTRDTQRPLGILTRRKFRHSSAPLNNSSKINSLNLISSMKKTINESLKVTIRSLSNFISWEVCQIKPFENQIIVYFYFPNFSRGAKNFARYESVLHIKAFQWKLDRDLVEVFATTWCPPYSIPTLDKFKCMSQNFMGRQPSVQSPMQKYIFGTKLQKMPKNKYRSFSVLLFLFGFLIFPKIFFRGL